MPSGNTVEQLEAALRFVRSVPITQWIEDYTELNRVRSLDECIEYHSRRQGNQMSMYLAKWLSEYRELKHKRRWEEQGREPDTTVPPDGSEHLVS